MKPKEYKRVFNYKETRCTIMTDRKTAIDAAISSIKYHRNQLDRYIKDNPEFVDSLRPVSVKNGPLIVKLMAEAAKGANVGPMAAVAGALSDLVVEDMILNGAKIAVVENGGEIYANSNRPINVVLSAGNSSLSIGFRLENFPIGIATSSGLFSHALSFGEAEAVTVFALKARMADAVATAAGNLVKGDDHRKAIERAIIKALSIERVKGVCVMYGGFFGSAGQIPKIIKVGEG